MAINNWLNSNYAKLTNGDMKGPREHLYYLIDSKIKHIFITQGAILPNEPDPLLGILFSWSERLGVYGGALVHKALKTPESTQSPSYMKVPEHFSLDLDGDLFRVSSNDYSWSVTFPYYFMISRLQEFDATNGLRTQILMVSTGAAVDRSEAGKSQATLLLIFSPGANYDEFSKYWVKNMGVDGTSEKRDLENTDRDSLYIYDSSAKLHREITIWSEREGPYAIAYLGNDGTYQWNRQHFIDFLHALKTN